MASACRRLRDVAWWVSNSACKIRGFRPRNLRGVLLQFSRLQDAKISCRIRTRILCGHEGFCAECLGKIRHSVLRGAARKSSVCECRWSVTRRAVPQAAPLTNLGTRHIALLIRNGHQKTTSEQEFLKSRYWEQLSKSGEL